MTPKIERAIAVAMKCHKGQIRKGDGVTPYIVHPVSVAMLLAQYIKDDDVIAAAILHDVLEDTSYGAKRLKKVFGKEVFNLVAAVTDKHPNDPWVTRKNAYLEHLKKVSKKACLIACADKINNLISMMEMHKKLGNSMWKRFNASKEDKLAFYEAIYRKARGRFKHPLIEYLGIVLKKAELALR